MPYSSAAGGIFVPARVAYMGTRLGGRSHLSLVRGRHVRVGGYPTRRLGASYAPSYSGLPGSSTQAEFNAAGAAGGAIANAIAPGSGSVVQPLIDSLAQVFQGNPAIGANAERQSKMYNYYAQAMTAPGSPSSVCAAQTLYAIAQQGMTPPCDTASTGYENNPQATRTYAQEALQVLSSQGWINVNSPNPQYIGVPQSGTIFAANQTTGNQQAVAQAPLPITPQGLAVEASTNPLGLLTSNPLMLVGGGIILALLLTRRPSSAKAA